MVNACFYSLGAYAIVHQFDVMGARDYVSQVSHPVLHAYMTDSQ